MPGDDPTETVRASRVYMFDGAKRPAGALPYLDVAAAALARAIEAESDLWLGAVGDIACPEPAASRAVVLCEAANWWPGTRQYSPGWARITAVPVALLRRGDIDFRAMLGNGTFVGQDPFLFRGEPGHRVCRVVTVGHEEFVDYATDDPATGAWLLANGFDLYEGPDAGRLACLDGEVGGVLPWDRDDV